MNTVAVTAPTVKPASMAFIVGAADAAQRDMCCPEMNFTHIDDKRDYCRGYVSIAGETLTTRQFLGGNR